MPAFGYDTTQRFRPQLPMAPLNQGFVQPAFEGALRSVFQSSVPQGVIPMQPTSPGQSYDPVDELQGLVGRGVFKQGRFGANSGFSLQNILTDPFLQQIMGQLFPAPPNSTSRFGIHRTQVAQPHFQIPTLDALRQYLMFQIPGWYGHGR